MTLHVSRGAKSLDKIRRISWPRRGPGRRNWGSAYCRRREEDAGWLASSEREMRPREGWLARLWHQINGALGECAVWCAIDNSAARGKGLLIKPTSNHPALHTASTICKFALTPLSLSHRPLTHKRTHSLSTPALHLPHRKQTVRSSTKKHDVI
jgi:hypothetical protein